MNRDDAEQAVREFFVQREGEGVMDQVRDIDLVDAGILDSLDFVDLSSFIEQKTGRKLDLSDPATFEAMRRYDTLVDLVASGDAGQGDASDQALSAN